MSESFALPERLVEHARRFAADEREPVAPRRASTVVLLRPASGGFEVYAISRAATMAFAAGMYAFPGGGVDPRDESVDVGWAGPSPRSWAARLGLDVATARAVVCAAVREVFEESGVLLAGPSPDAVVGDVGDDDWEAARAALVARTVGFADLLAAQGLVLRSDLLAPWARWVTPEFEPRRYDTHFFLARLPESQRTRDVGGEAAHAVWAAPAALAADRHPMLPPTRVTLRQLARYPDIDAALEAAAGRDAATPLEPRIDLGHEAGPRLVIPD